MLGKNNNKRHHQIQKIKIAQTMSITKHNKNGTTMRRSKKLFFFFFAHRCFNSVVYEWLKNVCMMVLHDLFFHSFLSFGIIFYYFFCLSLVNGEKFSNIQNIYMREKKKLWKLQYMKLVIITSFIERFRHAALVC